MKRIFIVGGGEGGSSLLKAFTRMETLKVMGISDVNVNAPAMMEARKYQIPTGTDYESMLTEDIEVILEATGDEKVFDHLCSIKPKKAVVIPASMAKTMMSLIREKESLIDRLRDHHHELDIILNSTYDGMIAVNQQGMITLFNHAAERITGLPADQMIHQYVAEAIPNTRLDMILKTGQPEINQEQKLSNDTRIVTNRVPVINQDGEIIGAVAVFRDVTDLSTLTEELMERKQTQSLLEAIINSSDDAISVVDVNGIGLMINPAYTRLTGLKERDVIGKPADADISEGESMHLKVLKTGKAVRGVSMKVGNQKKDVLVNVAPVYVDGELKGSVGIIHDTSEIKKLTAELNRARRIIRTLEAKYTFEEIIGESQKMKAAFDQAKKAASTPATVLLQGESGTGKELFAHAIHNDSQRKFNQFIRVNCAALSQQLLESELFGYEEGAFTGARRGGKKGLFEEASGGTLFLDEIGELTLETQAKLLRVLQEKEVIRVGGTKTIAVDVRVIAATNVQLEQAVHEGKFREDLYYRINVLPIHIPPLRNRNGDISLLAKHFINKFNLEYGRKVQEISPQAIQTLEQYEWPGNVRELENIISRAMIHIKFSEEYLTAEHVQPLNVKRSKGTSLLAPSNPEIEVQPLNEIMQQAEKEYLSIVLSKFQNNKTQAAKVLNISVRNLYYKLEKYGLHDANK